MMYDFLRNKKLLIGTAFLILVGTVLYFIPKSIDFRLNQLRINVDNDSYTKLSSQSNQAHEVGYLIREKAEYVQGRISYNSELTNVKLRLKGDWLDHLQPNKWSFRIKLEEPLKDSLKVFSVQNPACRSYLNGYVFHQLLKQEGILSNEFRFVHLYLNDDSWGIYCLEEHLTSRMIANQNKEEGVILKFDDDDGFMKAHKDVETTTDGLIKKATIKVYGDAKKNANFKTEIDRAKKIMHDYQFQVDSVYDLFDAEAMGKYYALCDLTMGYHSMGWLNIRFYYNFNTGKMEPVGYDPYPILNSYKPYLGASVKTLDNNPFETSMIACSPLKNKGIEKAYYEALRKYSSKEFVQEFLKKNQVKLKYFEEEIQKEFPEYAYDYNFLLDRSKEIRSYLNR